MPKKISGTTVNDQLATSFVTLTANLQRLSESENIVVVGVLKDLENEIVAKLHDNPDMTSWRKARYDALLSQTRETIKTSYTKIADHSQSYLEQVGTATSKGTASIFSSVGVPLQSVIVTDEQMRAIAKNSLINGSPARSWWAKQSTSLQDAFSQQMKIGYASGETVQQLVQRVRGRATGKRNTYIINGKKKVYVEFSGGIMDTGTRQAEALVRTATQQIGADAKMEMFRRNADILKGVMWLSTLDARTTPLCRAHDGLLYDLDGEPIGHDVSFMGGPPAHWNCRSVLVPVTKSFEELGATPGVTKEYLDQIGEGARASMNGEVPVSLTFDSWFHTLPKEDQIAFLGPKRYEIWKEAGLNFADMIDQRGNPLTIQQLAEAYGFKIAESQTSGIPNVPKQMVSAIAVEQQAQALASQMLEQEAAAASAKASAEAAAAQAEIDKISTSNNAFIKPVWEEYGVQLDGTPQENLAFLQAKIKHERTAQNSWSKLVKTVQAGTEDVASPSFATMMEQKVAIDQVKHISMPSQRMAAYKNALEQLKEQNKALKLQLSEMVQDTEKNPFLAQFQTEWLADAAKQGKKVPTWDMQQYQAELNSYIQMQDSAAAKKLIGGKGTPLELAIQTRALEEALKIVPQGAAGSNAMTLKKYEWLKKKITLTEKTASNELENLLLDADYKAAHATVMADNPSLLLPSDILQATKAKHQALVADAQEHLLAASMATGTVEKKAWNTLEAQFSGSSPIAKWAEYQTVLAKTQQEFANVGMEAIQDIIGTHKFANGVVTIGSKKFDVLDPQGLADFKKYKSMHLSKYKQAILAGKKVSPAHQIVYDNLSAAEKAAFDDSMAKALGKKQSIPPTSNAVPEPGTLQMSQMEKIGGQKGSNEGGFYRDRRTGTEYYIKFPASEDVARNELLAAKLYEAAGVEVPELTLLNDGSRIGIASKVKSGLRTGTAAELAKAIGAADNYAVDAWLANWDVVGLGYDNLLLTDAGTAFRVDVGGSLRYRAQGGLKGNAFGKVVEELDSLRNSKVNRQSASVFGKLKKADLEAGVKKVLDLSDDHIRQLVRQYGPQDLATANELADVLIARKRYLADKFPHLAKPVSVPPPADADLLVGDADMTAIRNGRINGYAIPADKNLIEDQNILVWFEKNEAGQDFTGLRFKFTEDALERINKVVGNVPPSKEESRLYGPFGSFRYKFEKQWDMIHAKAGQHIDNVLVQGNLDALRKAYNELVESMRGVSPELAEEFVALYERPMAELQKALAGKSAFEVSGMVAKGKSKDLSFGQVDLPGLLARVKERLAASTGELYFKRVEGMFYATHIKDGYAVRTAELLSRGGKWKSVYEATTPDGTHIRIWPGDSIAGRAFENQIEVLVPGNSQATVNKAMRLIESELGLPVSAPQLADREEMYLRMIARHRGDWDILDQVDNFRRESVPTSEISAYLKNSLSERLGSDITKQVGYNVDGTYEAFDSSFRRWFLPGIDADKKWAGFVDKYMLHHEITGGASIASTLDAVLNSGGRMLTTASKTRYGIPWGGASPEEDMRTGGADYFFTRIFAKKGPEASKPGLVWNSRMAARLDTISYDMDMYGDTSKEVIRRQSKHGPIEYMAAAEMGENELIFKNGLSLFDGLDHINCTSTVEAEQVLSVLKKHGWDKTWSDGRPIEDLVWVDGKRYVRSSKKERYFKNPVSGDVFTLQQWQDIYAEYAGLGVSVEEKMKDFLEVQLIDGEWHAL